MGMRTKVFTKPMPEGEGERLIKTIPLKRGRLKIGDFDEDTWCMSVWAGKEKKHAYVYGIYDDKEELKEILIKFGR